MTLDGRRSSPALTRTRGPSPHAASARHFFAPDSIALIGASRDLEKIPGRLLSMLRKNEFPGQDLSDQSQLRRYRRAEMLQIDRGCRPADRSRHRHHSRPRGARRARAMRRGGREERRHHLLGLCGGGRRQCRDAGRHRGAREDERACGFPAPMPKAFERGAEASPRPSARPSTSSRAMCRWSRPNDGSASSRKAAASALRSSIAPRRSAWRSATASAPAMKAISAPANFSDYMVQDASTDVILLFIEGIRDVDKFLAAAQPRRGNRQARHRDQSRPLRRGRARRRLAYRQHGRMVGSL